MPSKKVYAFVLSRATLRKLFLITVCLVSYGLPALLAHAIVLGCSDLPATSRIYADSPVIYEGMPNTQELLVQQMRDCAPKTDWESPLVADASQTETNSEVEPFRGQAAYFAFIPKPIHLIFLNDNHSQSLTGGPDKS